MRWSSFISQLGSRRDTTGICTHWEREIRQFLLHSSRDLVVVDQVLNHSASSILLRAVFWSNFIFATYIGRFSLVSVKGCSLYRLYCINRLIFCLTPPIDANLYLFGCTAKVWWRSSVFICRKRLLQSF